MTFNCLMKDQNQNEIQFTAPELAEENSPISRDLLSHFLTNGIKSQLELEDDNLDQISRERKASTTEEHDTLIQAAIENEVAVRDHGIKQRRNSAIQGLKLVAIKTDKYKYIGETLNGAREGFGICYYSNGDQYIGQWKANKKHGLGKLTLSNGDTNAGELVEDIFEGYCEIVSVEKQLSACGLAKEGKFIDEVIVHKGNKCIEGLKMNQLNSDQVCKITYSPQHYFIGNVDWSSVMLENGFGISVMKNLFIYMGEIKELKSNGYGEIYHTDGTRMYGFFKDNKKHGLVITIFKDGIAMIGEYVNDMKHGPFYIISKGYLKMELYLSGFRCKVVERIDNIRRYLQLNYPEHSHILKFNYKSLLDSLLQLKENEDILSEIMPKKVETTENK